MIKEDFTLKKDVLQLQKKIADMELIGTELKEAMSKFDTTILDDLKQRVDDIEDLTMVENAAVIELKKMLEQKTTEQTGQSTLDERLNSLEQKVSSINIPSVDEIKNSAPPSVQPTPADANDVEGKIGEIKSSFDLLQNTINSKIADLEERISQFTGAPSSSPDLEKFKSDIMSSVPDYSTIKGDVQTVIGNMKSEFEQEKQGLQKILDDIHKRLDHPLAEEAVAELEKIRSDWMVSNAKVEAVEKFVSGFSGELKALKPVFAKLETFDKFLDLHEDVTQKLQDLKSSQSMIQETVAKYDDVEKRIQHDMSKFKETGQRIAEIEKYLSKMDKEMEKTKKETEKGVDSLQDDMSLLQGNLMALEQGGKDITSSLGQLQEDRFKMQKDIESIKTLKSKDNSNELVNRISGIEADIESLKTMETDELMEKINKLEDKIEAFDITELWRGDVSEIIERMVFIESRLAAMEGMMQNMPRYSPIVVE